MFEDLRIKGKGTLSFEAVLMLGYPCHVQDRVKTNLRKSTHDKMAVFGADTEVQEIIDVLHIVIEFVQVFTMPVPVHCWNISSFGVLSISTAFRQSSRLSRISSYLQETLSLFSI